MTTSQQNRPEWLKRLDLSRFTLYSGATEEQIAAAEAIMGYPLPDDYREFLRVSNGGMYNGFIFDPIDETNRAAGSGVVALDRVSRDPAVWPVLSVGTVNFGSDESIGFLKEDLAAAARSRRVFVFWHESGDCDVLADSFQELIEEVAELAPDEEYVPRWWRTPSYYGTDIDVRLGDRVKVRRWFFWWRDGIVSYLPGVSPPHPEMTDEAGNQYWSIDMGNGNLLSWIYLPEKIWPKRNIRFVRRGGPETNALQATHVLQ